MSEVFEFAGFACFAALLYFVWPPLAFVPLGIFFILVGLALDSSLIPTISRRNEADNEPD